jgi:hypothetical protein
LAESHKATLHNPISEAPYLALSRLRKKPLAETLYFY